MSMTFVTRVIRLRPSEVSRLTSDRTEYRHRICTRVSYG
jgi:hypothetical protein